jgi:23S rRNA (cytidine1920-2'-O)/16S rRNA (cytidine1409-2'-O)-methyltransferase
MERTNARHLDSLPEPVDIVVIDVSFISLALMFPAVKRILKPGGVCVPLIKPQFEAGRENVGKRGVVRDPAIHEMVLRNVLGFARDHGFVIRGIVSSPLRGPNGNIEFLAHIVNDSGAEVVEDDALVAMAMQGASSVGDSPS